MNFTRDITPDTARSTGPSRRTVLTTAAWATPVIAASTAIPAFAASEPVTVLTLTFGQSVYAVLPGGTLSLTTSVRNASGLVPNAPVTFTISDIEAGESPSEPGETETDSGASADPTAAFGRIGGPRTATATTLANGTAVPPTVYVGLGFGVLRIDATVVVGGASATAVAYVRVMQPTNLLALGYGGTGQMGNGGSKNNAVLSGVALPPGTTVIGTGPYRTAYAMDDRGYVWSWGSDYGHQQFARGTQKSPVLATTLPRDIIQIDGSYYSGFAVTSGGQLYGWGYQGYYVFGNGKASGYLESQTLLTNISDVKKVAGSWTNVYVLKNDGTLWVMGAGSSGSLGLGAAGGNAQTPTRITGFPAGRTVIDVDSRYYGGIALLDDGTVWTWGYNAHGACGLGHTRAVNSPTQVPGIFTATAVYSGWYNSSAVLADGTAKVWGKGAYYNLGNGATALSSVPVALGVTNVKQLSWGCETGHALTTSGTMYGWGYNGNYEVGIGRTGAVKTPQALPGAVGIASIASTMYATYALAAV